MHGKGATGWIRSYLGGLTLIFGRDSRGLPRIALLAIHTRLHLLHVFRVLTGRTGRPVRNTRLFKYRVSAPATDLLAFLVQTVFMRRDYAFACEKKNPTILDCGSNIGLSVLWFKRRYPDAKITAFEPSSRAFEYLKNNVEDNRLQNVELRRQAVAGRDEERTFYTDADDDGALGASLTTRLKENPDRNVREDVVTCVALSGVIEGSIDILKIDVEGAEQEVLADLAEKQLLDRINEMFVEFHHNPCNPENRLTDILNILDNAGFETVVDSRRSPPYPRHCNKPYKCNLYARRQEKSDAPGA